ncbi:xylan 1,4-beta-xylosidase-like [Patiria miniata]|uniref:Fibronectin type III-like domain-containing protein n=1 Tax=Patiria miniata TaxID=46514 RepID=A0A914AQP8_PATMI|nr:xylan 1,4-beta-xylosidase-like [Patiria miniata]
MAAKYLLISLLSLLLSTNALLASSTEFPFQNFSLPWEERLADLISRLELDDIVLQLARGGAGPNGPTPPIPRLGIGPYNWNTECLRGDVQAGNATSFPQAIGIAASFSVDLANSLASATSEEVRAKYNNFTQHGIHRDHCGLSCFSPVVNIMRHPLWGRNQETYGEDPYLTGEMAKAFVNGLQGLQGPAARYLRTAAGCKHFAVYSGPEDYPSSRYTFNAGATERDLYMTYLPAFRECVKAGAYSVMCSYNSIDSIPACVDQRFLTDILRTEFGFKGYVVSERNALEYVFLKHNYTQTPLQTAVAGVKAGCNLEQADWAQNVYTNLTKAVQAGLVTEDELRQLVRPLFYTRLRLGEFDPPEMNPWGRLQASEEVESLQHQNFAVLAAVQSFVLLKNANNTLPIGRVNKIAIIGPFANSPQDLFGSYAPQTDPKFISTPWDGLRRLGRSQRLAAGCNNPICDQYNQTAVMDAVTGVDLVIACLGTGTQVENEGLDRRNMSLPGHQLELLQNAVKYAVGKPLILLLFNGGPLDIGWADNSTGVHAIMECFYPAQATGTAVHNVLINSQFPTDASPSGKLPFTWPRSLDQVPAMTNYNMTNRTYRYFTGDPLYPFGYGLSYTQFNYINITVGNTTIHPCDNLMVYVTLVNTGTSYAYETVQVYIKWHNASVTTPNIQLAAFNRFRTTPYNKVTDYLTIPARVRAVFTNALVLEPGVFTVYGGGQQPDQKRQVGSNVVNTTFTVAGPVTPLSTCP